MALSRLYPKKVKTWHNLYLLFWAVPGSIIMGWAKPINDYGRWGLFVEVYGGLWYAITNNEEWGYGFHWGEGCTLTLLQRVQEYSFYIWDSMLDDFL